MFKIYWLVMFTNCTLDLKMAELMVMVKKRVNDNH